MPMGKLDMLTEYLNNLMAKLDMLMGIFRPKLDILTG